MNSAPVSGEKSSLAQPLSDQVSVLIMIAHLLLPLLLSMYKEDHNHR